MKTMTKAELVEEVARASELNKRDAEVIVETVFDSIISALHRGEKVELRGFGSFRTRERGPRRGRNPKTGAPVDVPAKRVPYFKPGKELKEFFTDGDGQETAAPDASPAANEVPAAAIESAAPSPATSAAAPVAESAAPSPAESPAPEPANAENAGGDGETKATLA